MRITDLPEEAPLIELALTRSEAAALGALIGQTSVNKRAEMLREASDGGRSRWGKWDAGDIVRANQFFDQLYDALGERFGK